MSVIRSPISGLYFTVCLAIVMSGCAANKLTVIPVVEAFSERATGHKVSNCRSTQRDLTTPWSLRQYWCGAENRKGGLQNTNNDLMDQVAANHSAADQAYIESINNEINQLDYETPIVDSDISIEAIAPSTNQKDAINRLKNIERSDKLKTLPDSKPPTEKVSSNPIRSKATGSIIFAHHLKILGPQGRAATHALIDQVSSSNKVLIRGLVLPDEILVDSKRYREQVSVGRALAVRKYWKEQGIDTAHIIILHYDAGLSGRSVDVTFNG